MWRGPHIHANQKRRRLRWMGDNVLCVCRSPLPRTLRWRTCDAPQCSRRYPCVPPRRTMLPGECVGAAWDMPAQAPRPRGPGGGGTSISFGAGSIRALSHHATPHHHHHAHHFNQVSPHGLRSANTAATPNKRCCDAAVQVSVPVQGTATTERLRRRPLCSPALEEESAGPAGAFDGGHGLHAPPDAESSTPAAPRPARRSVELSGAAALHYPAADSFVSEAGSLPGSTLWVPIDPTGVIPSSPLHSLRRTAASPNSNLEAATPPRPAREPSPPSRAPQPRQQPITDVASPTRWDLANLRRHRVVVRRSQNPLVGGLEL